MDIGARQATVCSVAKSWMDMTEVAEDACTHIRSEISYSMCFLPYGIQIIMTGKTKWKWKALKLPLWPS